MARQASTKTRSTIIPDELLGVQYTGTGSPQPKSSRSYLSSETIIGSNHKGPPYRSGGPMFLTRNRLTRTHSSSYFGSVAGGSKKNAYEGKFQPGYVPNAIPVPTSYNLDALGTEAVSRTIPTSPSASLSTYLGELRDFPGMIKQTRKFFHGLMKAGVKLHRGNATIGDALRDLSDPSRAAGDYLNLQFGWLPFVRDLHSFYKTGKELDKRVAFIRRNNMGKPIARSRKLESWDYTTVAEATVNNALAPMLSPIVHSFLYATGAACSSRTRTVRQYGNIWFKATYKYYSPELASTPDWAIKADILGLRLDPAVIYQLTPWSWLLDWFTTTGAAVSNAVEFSRYHVVMDHGYVMSHMSSRHRSIDTQKMRVGYGAGAGSPTTMLSTSAECLYETKQRVAANPFGFGVNWNSLSGYQLSILAALGISRRSRDQ